MLNKAYIFVETVLGRSREVAIELGKNEWIEFAERVTGAYDIVAVTRGHSTEDINAFVNGGLSFN